MNIIIEVRDGAVTIVHSDQPVNVSIFDWDSIEKRSIPEELGDNTGIADVAVHDEPGDCIEDVFNKLKQMAYDVLD